MAALLALLITLAVEDYRPGIAVAVGVTADAQPSPEPNPGPRPGVCENCNGTGKLGDGVVSVDCPVCGGDGRIDSTAAIKTTDASADQQATPWPIVGKMLNKLDPKPVGVLLDPGCGRDARLLVEAIKYGIAKRAIGIEIDPGAAEAARRRVEVLGLSGQIAIFTGDSTDLEDFRMVQQWQRADAAVCYMWPNILATMRPQLAKLDCVVSFAHAVPGLSMTKDGEIYVWKKPQPAATPQNFPPPTNQVIPWHPPVSALWNGRTYSRPVCTSPFCTMCNSIRSQLRY